MKEFFRGVVFFKESRASATLEYAILITLILAALGFFSQYIGKAVSGKWKSVGDSLGYERQFDPNKTIQCAYDPGSNLWYAQLGFESCFREERKPGGTRKLDYNRCLEDCYDLPWGSEPPPNQPCVTRCSHPAVEIKECHVCCDECSLEAARLRCINANQNPRCTSS